MGDFDVVTELRAKWCCILEEQLECPICFEINTSAEIIQCINGHNICSDCRKHLSVCPSCDGRFSTTRNRMMETLIKQFEEMKSSLMDPEGDKNQWINKKKKSVSSQTDPEVKIIKFSVGCQTDLKIQRSSIATQIMETDFIKKEVGESIVNNCDKVNGETTKNNVGDLVPPKVELGEVKPALRRSTRLKSKSVH